MTVGGRWRGLEVPKAVVRFDQLNAFSQIATLLLCRGVWAHESLSVKTHKHTTALLESETFMETIMEKGGHETRRFRVQSESVPLIHKQAWFHTCLSTKHATDTLNRKREGLSRIERVRERESNSSPK
jgi:hypothetical protein